MRARFLNTSNSQTLILRDLSDLVSRMALYCGVPSEARAISEGGVPSGVRRVIESRKSQRSQRLTSLELSNGQISRGQLSRGQLSRGLLSRGLLSDLVPRN